MKLPPIRSLQADLIEKNLQFAFRFLANEHKRFGQSEYVFSDIPHPIFNCIISAQLRLQDLPEAIETIKQEYGKREHCWWITQRSEPQGIEEVLNERGYQKGPYYRGMHLSLKQKLLPLTTDPALRIKQVDTAVLLKQWGKPLAEAFEFTDPVMKPLLEIFTKHLKDTKQVRHYIAYYEDSVVGCTSAIIDGKTVGLYNGAVTPAYRKKGILTALASTMIEDAKQDGLTDCVSHVSDLAVGVAKNLGFLEYLKIQSFLSTA